MDDRRVDVVSLGISLNINIFITCLWAALRVCLFPIPFILCTWNADADADEDVDLLGKWPPPLGAIQAKTNSN